MASKKQLEAIISIAGSIDPSLQKSISGVQKQFSGLKMGMAAVGVAAAATAAAVTKFGVDAVKAAASFETEMANVATLLNGTKEQVSARINELGDQVLEVSNKTGVSADNLSDGLYQIISAVGDSDDAIVQMELAAKAAKAGCADTTDAVNLLTAVTKGYGDTSGEAFQKASDLAFTTVKLGQTSFPELAASIGKVIPLASAMNMSQEELFGSFATLTGVTGSTAEVATQMKAVMSGFMSPSKNMSKALKSLGYDNANAALEALGLEGTLSALSDTVGGDTMQLAKMFNSVEAQTAVLALAGAQADDFKDKTQAMKDAAGATDTAFEAQTDTFEYTVQALKNMGDNFMITVGRSMLPQLKELGEKYLPKIQDFMIQATPVVIDFFAKGMDGAGKLKDGVISLKQKFDEFCQLINNASKYMRQHKTAATLTAIALGTLATAITAYTIASNAAAIASGIETAAIAVYCGVTGAAAAVTTALSAALAFLTSPVTLVIAAIGALIAAGVLLYQNWDTVCMYAGKVWDTICTTFGGIADFLGGCFGAAVGIVKGNINAVIAIVNGAIDAIDGLAISIPDWVPSLGGKTFSLGIPHLPMLASGGFTNGVSIAGEAGTEAVISFDPSYRSDNLSYWAKAGRMLGVDDAFLTRIGGGRGNSNLNVTFAPNITINGTGDAGNDVINALRQYEEEFMDMLQDMTSRRGGETYGYNY